MRDKDFPFNDSSSAFAGLSKVPINRLSFRACDRQVVDR
jgi:hypothetical protein